MAWVSISSSHVVFMVRVKPNAACDSFVKYDPNYLYISLKASPMEGKANESLIRFLSKFFKIPQKEIEILAGEKSRTKRIKLPLSPFVVDQIQQMKNTLKNET